MTWCTHNAAAAASLSSIHLQMTWRRPFQLSLPSLVSLLVHLLYILLSISYSLLILILDRAADVLRCPDRPCVVRFDLVHKRRKNCAALLSSPLTSTAMQCNSMNGWMNKKEITKQNRVREVGHEGAWNNHNNDNNNTTTTNNNKRISCSSSSSSSSKRREEEQKKEKGKKKGIFFWSTRQYFSARPRRRRRRRRWRKSWGKKRRFH